jgi:succinate dehydrogenase / fumarate reductase cytochrome b subunit
MYLQKVRARQLKEIFVCKSSLNPSCLAPTNFSKKSQNPCAKPKTGYNSLNTIVPNSTNKLAVFNTTNHKQGGFFSMSATTVGVIRLTQSSIGKKVIMAVTGLIWIGFVFFHMYGNLKVFGGPAYFNEYAEGLREIGHPIFARTHLLWIARLGLIGAIVAHVWAAYSLAQQSRTARPVGYAHQQHLETDFASLTMRWGGVAIFLFLIFHIAHFTLGVPGVHPDFIGDDAYYNLVVGFQSYYYIPAIIYLLAMVALGLHLYHGTWSLFQTLGLNNKTYTKVIQFIALALAIIVAVGFAIIPISVMAGIVS